MEYNINEDLICEFLFRFALFEEALKRAGFLKEHRFPNAEAYWLEFAQEEEIEQMFAESNSEIADQIEFLSNSDSRPWKRVADENGLDWRNVDASQDTRAKNVLVYVRRVRNNLFHGAKFEDMVRLEDRYERLINCSLVILEKCADAYPNVGQEIEELKDRMTHLPE